MILSEPKARQHKILLFDSGVGGLSLIPHIRKQLPNSQINYLADNALFPYGLLTEEPLIARCCLLIGEFCHEQQPDLVVIGCNSASTVVLPRLREQLTIPVVGVVPAIKPAAAISQSKVVGLLATPGTIQRGYTDKLIAEFAADCTVIRIGANSLVEAVENQFHNREVDKAVFQQIAEDFLQQPQAQDMDAIVLACTHFPHAKQALQQALPQVKHWVDSGEAIARRISTLLQEKVRDESFDTAEETAYFTGTLPVNSALQTFGFQQLKHWQPGNR